MISLLALTPQQEQQAQALGRVLRCPVCQGMPIGESPAPMAQSMMALVRQKVAAGDSGPSIKHYFVQRYGEWIVLDPGPQGAVMWIWVLPPCALVVAALIFFWQIKVPTTTKTVLPKEDDSLTAIRQEVDR